MRCSSKLNCDSVRTSNKTLLGHQRYRGDRTNLPAVDPRFRHHPLVSSYIVEVESSMRDELQRAL
jgi:hypothetical protein